MASMLDAGIASGLREASVWALPILIAIPLHEAATDLPPGAWETTPLIDWDG